MDGGFRLGGRCSFSGGGEIRFLVMRHWGVVSKRWRRAGSLSHHGAVAVRCVADLDPWMRVTVGGHGPAGGIMDIIAFLCNQSIMQSIHS